MRYKRAIAALQSVAIAALIVSAVLLGRASGMLDGVIASLPFIGTGREVISSSPGGSGAGLAETSAVRPMCIAVINEDGERGFAKYDMDALDLLYDRTGGILGEALGAAAKVVICAEAEWREALCSQGIYFEYVLPVKLSVLDGWLGAEVSAVDGELEARRLCVVFGESVNLLYLQDERDGAFYRAEAVAIVARPQLPATYEGVARFAFESGYDGAAPYMILTESGAHPIVNIYNPLTSQAATQALLEAVGVNTQLQSSYQESDGTSVYVTAEFTLRIAPDGGASYHRTGAVTSAGDETPIDIAIEIARRSVYDTVGRFRGDARVYFSGIWKEKSGYIVTFDYFVSGGRAYLTGGESAAAVRVSGGAVTDMELFFRNFDVTDEYETLLPEVQTLAAAGEEFFLCYSDSYGGAMEPYWASVTEILRAGGVAD
jgi:hypothetical protein